VSTVRTRAVFVAVGAAAVLAFGTASAAAAPATLVDDTFAEFAAAPGGTGTWVTEPGAVRLRPTALSEAFDGPGPDLPATLTSVAWNAPDGSAVVGAGALTLDGVRVHPAATTLAAPQELEFRATFANALNQHVGLGTDFDTGAWAMFSTGNAEPPRLYVRTRKSDLTAIQNDPIAGIENPLGPHTYRIEWLPTEVRYFVDGDLVATHLIEITTPMRPVASDFTAGGGAITIDWLGLGPDPASGVFESRVLDAGDERAVWGALTATASGGGTIGFETRTGNTATPDGAWSPWQPTGAGGAIASPIRRYIQYRATLSQGSPILDRVEIAYEVDTVAPSAVIDGVDVSGGSASVRFSSPDADLDRFECRLGAAGSFASCVSPQAFAGLSTGSYTVFVRAVDDAGNVSPVVERGFVIPAPPSSGGQDQGGTTSPPPDNPAPEPELDETAPAVEVLTRSARASRTGLVALRVSCPDDEVRCRVTLRLQHGRMSSRRKTVALLGGKGARISVRLPNAARTRLAERGRLRVIALVTARDDAGNVATIRHRFVLRAPSG
jgi:hypothetical protein